jgi:hypothetical protein
MRAFHALLIWPFPGAPPGLPNSDIVMPFGGDHDGDDSQEDESTDNRAPG